MHARRSSVAVVCAFIAFTSQAWAYRPYDSTDADVVDTKELELELGWRDSKLETDKEHAARVVLNFGVGHGREIVLEGEWQRSRSVPGEWQSSVGDVALLMKQVHRRGSLQDERGLSIASECGVLIPTTSEASGAGAECTLIASHRNSALSLHANAGVAIETDHRWAHSFGLILEGADSRRLRPGLELRQEDVEGQRTELSILAGLIWSATDGLAFDLAYRRGLEPTREPIEWRIGFKWSN